MVVLLHVASFLKEFKPEKATSTIFPRRIIQFSGELMILTSCLKPLLKKEIETDLCAQESKWLY